MKVAIDFYKNLFAKEVDSGVKLVVNFWEEENKVTRRENDLLTAPFSKAKIKEGIFSCYAEGAHGSDGLTFLFFQKFWDMIKRDSVALFETSIRGS
jgi:hypothetical protein